MGNLIRCAFSAIGLAGLMLIAACSGPGAGEGGETAGPSTTPRPSILVFVADDAGARDFGIYGNDAISTPNIDRLGAEGLIADAAILTTPQCSPSRISMLTGMYPHATGAEDLHVPLPENHAVVASYLSKSGYFTGGLRKMHLGDHGESQFDWYRDDLTSLPEFLEEAGDRPFFMWVGFIDPHRDYDRQETPQVNDPADVTVPPWLADTPSTRRDLADYYNEISRMDGDIGRMLQELEQAGRSADTLVLFISDNGAPFPRAKGTLYDTGVRTPFVARWPGRIEPGSRHDRLISVIDLAPTFLALAGLDVPGDMQGESMADGLSDPEKLGRAYAFSQRNWHNTDEHMRSVRTQRYKLISNAYTDRPYGTASDIGASPAFKDLLAAREAGSLSPVQAAMFAAPRPDLELYDLADDPLELNDVAEEPAYTEVRRDLVGVLEQWQARTGDFPANERRRPDNVDRQTGERLPGMQRLPDPITEE